MYMKTINNDNNDNNYQLMGGDEFVMIQQKGGNGETEFVGGGYKIKSFFLEGGQPIITTLNNGSIFVPLQDGGKVYTPFDNLAVPAGLFYINQKTKRNTSDKNYRQHEMLPDDIFDKLFGLVEADKKIKRKTRKHVRLTSNKKSNKNKTYKNK